MKQSLQTTSMLKTPVKKTQNDQISEILKSITSSPIKKSPRVPYLLTSQTKKIITEKSPPPLKHITKIKKFKKKSRDQTLIKPSPLKITSPLKKRKRISKSLKEIKPIFIKETNIEQTQLNSDINIEKVLNFENNQDSSITFEEKFKINFKNIYDDIENHLVKYLWNIFHYNNFEFSHIRRKWFIEELLKKIQKEEIIFLPTNLFNLLKFKEYFKEIDTWQNIKKEKLKLLYELEKEKIIEDKVLKNEEKRLEEENQIIYKIRNNEILYSQNEQIKIIQINNENVELKLKDIRNEIYNHENYNYEIDGIEFLLNLSEFKKFKPKMIPNSIKINRKCLKSYDIKEKNKIILLGMWGDYKMIIYLKNNEDLNDLENIFHFLKKECGWFMFPFYHEFEKEKNFHINFSHFKALIEYLSNKLPTSTLKIYYVGQKHRILKNEIFYNPFQNENQIGTLLVHYCLNLEGNYFLDLSNYKGKSIKFMQYNSKEIGDLNGITFINDIPSLKKLNFYSNLKIINNHQPIIKNVNHLCQTFNIQNNQKYIEEIEKFEDDLKCYEEFYSNYNTNLRLECVFQINIDKEKLEFNYVKLIPSIFIELNIQLIEIEDISFYFKYHYLKLNELKNQTKLLNIMNLQRELIYFNSGKYQFKKSFEKITHKSLEQKVWEEDEINDKQDEFLMNLFLKSIENLQDFKKWKEESKNQIPSKKMFFDDYYKLLKQYKRFSNFINHVKNEDEFKDFLKKNNFIILPNLNIEKNYIKMRLKSSVKIILEK